MITMGELVPDDKSGMLGLMHGKGGDLVIPKPFERDIFLFDTHIAGTGHIEGIEELESHMHENYRLDFYREPDNPYDNQAIMIRNSDGIKIGYVPRADNVIFARLMDAGKLLFGRITSIEMLGTWLRIGIRVYLHE